jgi:hypothetical protein
MPINHEKEQCTALYFMLAEKIKKVCITNGYALGVHGSLINDLDIVAVPWTDKAVKPRILAACIFEDIKNYTNHIDKKPTKKPHGRLCWTVLLDWHAYIDLCIMPLLNVQKQKDGS